MGYDIHITRSKGSYFENGGSEISAEEWLKCVNDDSELHLAGYNGKYFAIWLGKSVNEEPWFDWSGGNVNTKNPDPSIIEKAISIAVKLGARVQGDDGEVYLHDGKIEQDGKVVNKPGMNWREW